MATGRSNKLVGQTGEYLVAAELSRQGLIATTFTGNVPDYDIIASDAQGRHVSVQVKASQGNSWHLDFARFCNVRFQGKRQIVGSGKKCPVRRLVVVFVSIDVNRADRFYICTWQCLRGLLIKGHKAFLKRNHGIRPRNPTSMHSAILEKTLQPYLDKWVIIKKNLR